MPPPVAGTEPGMSDEIRRLREALRELTGDFFTLEEALNELLAQIEEEQQ